MSLIVFCDMNQEFFKMFWDIKGAHFAKFLCKTSCKFFFSPLQNYFAALVEKEPRMADLFYLGMNVFSRNQVNII